ncbi:MAG: hypothetical protein GQ570_01665 [Helicobacteraceae bacterium]|nr:hypothetical protein [Helicobacteraceae bacterium]
MKLVFIHGWSVMSIETYGDMPTLLQQAVNSSASCPFKIVPNSRHSREDKIDSKINVKKK